MKPVNCYWHHSPKSKEIIIINKLCKLIIVFVIFSIVITAETKFFLLILTIIFTLNQDSN